MRTRTVVIATLSGIGRVPDASAMIYLTAAANTVHFPALGRPNRSASVDKEGHQLPASAHAVSAHPASAAQPRIAVSIPIVKGASGTAVLAPLHFGVPVGDATVSTSPSPPPPSPPPLPPPPVPPPPSSATAKPTVLPTATPTSSPTV